MTLEVLWMLGLVALTLTLFVLEWFPIEVTALALLGILLLTGTMSLDLAISGFSNKAVLTIGSLFVLSHGLFKTGLLEIAADYLGRKVGQRSWLGIGIFLTVASVLSGFLNNTAVVALFIPLAISLCRRFQISPSQVLIPLSYLSILGGMLTLIGTSTNLLVSALGEAAGLAPLGMFEVTRLGILTLAFGLLYVLLLAPRLLPPRVDVSSLTGKYEMKPYLTELRVTSDSALAGKSVQEAQIAERYDVSLLSIIRKGRRLYEDLNREPLQPGDVLIVQGKMDDVVALRNDLKVALLSDIKLSDPELSGEGQIIVEGLVPPNSSLVGRTLKEIDFRRHFGAFVMAIRRHGSTLHSRLARIPLKGSDALLMTLPKARLPELRRSEEILVLSELELSLHRHRFWWVPVVLLPLIVLLAALGVADILQGALLGCILLLILGVVKPQEAYQAIDWPVIFLIAAFVPVGEAMVRTGTAEFLASLLLSLSGGFPEGLRPQATLALIYLLTSLMTQMVSNNAAAIIITPVSLSLAAGLGLDPRPFLIAVCFAASAEFMTPMGYQTNMMVYAPGGYRFLDYTRFGAPLNLGCWLLASTLIPTFWPFQPA